MRVIFLTHNYPRRQGDLPGSFLHPLALALRAAGVDLRVVAPSDHGRGGQEALDGIPVRRVRYAPASWERLAYTGRMQEALRSPGGLLALAGLWRALRAGVQAEAAGARGPVVVHAHWWFPAGLAAPPGLPAVVTLHGTDGRLLARGLGRRLGRYVLQRAAVVTAVSDSLARMVAESVGRTLPADCIQPMPVEVGRLQRSTGGGGIVTVARLTAQKRLSLLLDAVAGLRREGMELPVTIAGDGPERQALAAEVQRLGLTGQVHLVGHLDPSAVAALLATARLFVLPAEREGFGLAAAEALMAGVPVVACTDGGGLADLLGSFPGGRLAAPEGPALAAAIRDLLAATEAPGAAWTAGQHLRQQLAPDAVAARAIAWYRQAAAGR